MVAGLTTGENVWLKSTPARWEKPRTTHQALRCSNEPSGCNLFLKIHLPVITLACCGRGTRVHVPLDCRTSNSSCIAIRQLGSRRAARMVVGEDGGEAVVAMFAYFRFGR